MAPVSAERPGGLWSRYGPDEMPRSTRAPISLRRAAFPTGIEAARGRSSPCVTDSGLASDEGTVIK